MTDFNYFTGIPNPSNNPSTDAPNMQTNTNSAAGIWDVDHYGFQDNNGGKHDIIHIPLPQAVTPATGALEWAEYTRSLAAGSVETFWKRPNTIAGAPDIQMTTNIAISTAFQNGQTFLPGGIIVKWGTFSGFTSDSSQSGVISFVPKFPTGVFNIFAQAFYLTTAPGSSGGSMSIQKPTVTNSDFIWTFSTGSGQFTGGGFYWVAIGN
jgi:hypothetical protein